jgi:hypothetical protein
VEVEKLKRNPQRKNNMKPQRKAPRVSKYNFDENYMRESDTIRGGKLPISRMRKKRLSD